MKNKEIILYMDMAHRIAEQSTANRLKVGAVLVTQDGVISIGYNGTPAGTDNTCEDEDNNTLPNVIHAEMNCLFKMIRSGHSTKNSVLIMTHSPCRPCAQAIYLAGVSMVIYKNLYRCEGGISLLSDLNIPCIQVDTVK